MANIFASPEYRELKRKAAAGEIDDNEFLRQEDEIANKYGVKIQRSVAGAAGPASALKNMQDMRGTPAPVAPAPEPEAAPEPEVTTPASPLPEFALQFPKANLVDPNAAEAPPPPPKTEREILADYLNGIEQRRAEEQALRQKQSEGSMGIGMLAGLNTMAQAGLGRKADNAPFQQMQKDSQVDLDSYLKNKMAGEKETMDVALAKAKLDAPKKEKRDPKYKFDAKTRQWLKGVTDASGNIVEWEVDPNYTLKQGFKDTGDKQLDLGRDRLQQTAFQFKQSEARRLAQFVGGVAKTQAGYTQKLSETFKKQEVPTIKVTMDDIDRLVGPSGEIPGIGPVENMFDDKSLAAIQATDPKRAQKAQDIRTALQNFINVKLKQMSGAAVTKQEADRFYAALATGSLKTEKSFREAWGRVKRAFDEDVKNMAAGIPPSAVDQYLKSGGTDLPALRELASHPDPMGVIVQNTLSGKYGSEPVEESENVPPPTVKVTDEMIAKYVQQNPTYTPEQAKTILEKRLSKGK
jgi:hypothetical protein